MVIYTSIPSVYIGEITSCILVYIRMTSLIFITIVCLTVIGNVAGLIVLMIHRGIFM